MIDGRMFEGDDATLSKQQLEVYREALWVIVSSIYTHLQRAAEMLDIPNRHAAAESRDHRTIQMAHDILAAAWRFQTEHLDLFEPKPSHSMHDWLTWLRGECESWHLAPGIVRLFLTIFENQNTGIGYDAENALARALLRRFTKVPWQERYTALF